MSVLDFIPIAVVLLAFSVSTLVGLYVLDAFQAGTSDLMSTAQGDLAINNTRAALLGFDYLFVFILFGLGLAVMISAFMIKTHPAFFIVSLLSFVFVLTITAQFSNAFAAIAFDSQLLSTAANFPLMEAVWHHLPTIFVALGILLIIVMYGRFKGGDTI